MDDGDYQRLIQDLLDRHGSYGELGKVLARTIDPGRMPFSRQYVERLLKGKSRITEEIGQALEVLGAMADGVSEIQASAREYTVLATHPLARGVVVLGRPKPCNLPGCPIQFVPVVPWQNYCSDDCRKEATKRRRHGIKVRKDKQ